MDPSVSISPAEEKLGFNYVLDMLHKDGIISNQQYAQVKKLIPTPDETVHPLVLIADQGLKSDTKPAYPLTLEKLTSWLAEKTGSPYLRIDPLKIDVNNVTRAIPQAYASKLHILPVEVNARELVVATCEPFISGWENELSRSTKLHIKRVIANPKDIERYLVEFYGISRSIFGAVKSKAADAISKIQNFEQLVEVGKAGEPDANDQHIVSIVDWLLQYAFEQRASDIHLEPRRDKGKVRFRIDGKMQQVHEFPMIIMGAIASRLKSLGRMDVTDKRRPQDGRIKTKTPAGTEVEMRLSTMPTAFGEKLVIRIFNPEMLFKDFTALGFTRHDLMCWKEMTGHPHGIILVTGPTGSGKTTTLYSALKDLSRPELNICSIEDPIEMVDPEFNQMQVQNKIGVDFASGVRTLLRQDPDIIMVGEIRDYETAEIAIQAALTGHLVLSSLHTNDAPSSITRLVDIGAQPFLISATLLGVMAQRLVRTLCPHCKQHETLDKALWDKLVSPAKVKLPEKTCKPVGCDECRHTGYYGRIGIFEALPVGKTLRQLITANADIETIRATAVKQGMWSLRLSGAQKVAEGLTTLEEIYSVIPPDDAG